MKKLFYKELRLVLTPILYLFTILTLMIFVPQFPPISNMAYSLIGLISILNVALGERDFEFTALLPVPRNYIVASKCFDLVYAQLLQLIVAIPCSLILIFVFPSQTNVAGQNTNMFFFAKVIVAYMVFNMVFLPYFFKTADQVNKPLFTGLFSFVLVAIIGQILILKFPILNGVESDGALLRVGILIMSILVYILGTYFAYKKAARNFERVSL